MIWCLAPSWTFVNVIGIQSFCDILQTMFVTNFVSDVTIWNGLPEIFLVCYVIVQYFKPKRLS